MSSLCGCTIALLEGKRYLSHEGSSHIFQILTATDNGVHVLADEDDDYRDKQSEGERHEQDIFLYRCSGYHASARHGDDAGIVGGERL